MFRFTAMTATVLYATALVSLAALMPASAQGVGEACHGQGATLLGSLQAERLVGTEGSDVIVSNGSRVVESLGGDDVICVTGSPAAVFAGGGNDLVDGSTLTKRGAQVELGAGSDSFIGGPAVDAVWGGEEVEEGTGRYVDTEVDVIETGPAASELGSGDSVESGQDGRPNADVIRMGRGRLEWDGVPADGAVMDGGADSSIVLDISATDEIAVNNVAETIAFAGGATLEFTGFTGFSVLGFHGARAFSFVGSDRDESLNLELHDPSAQTLDMGGGDDQVHFYSVSRHTYSAGTSYDGGSGRDELRLTLPNEVDADVDLRRGRLSVGSSSDRVTSSMPGFEDLAVVAKEVEVIGTGGPNEIGVAACRSRVDARGGNDKVDTFDIVMDERAPCRKGQATFLGGSGNDKLKGPRGSARLIGGRGRDYAKRRSGRDQCKAEKVLGCERRH